MGTLAEKTSLANSLALPLADLLALAWTLIHPAEKLALALVVSLDGALTTASTLALSNTSRTVALQLTLTESSRTVALGLTLTPAQAVTVPIKSRTSPLALPISLAFSPQ